MKIKSKNQYQDGYLRKFSEFIFRNRRLTLICIVILTVLSLLILSSLELDPRWTRALPRDHQLVHDYLKIIEDPTRGSLIYAVIDGPDPEGIARQFAAKMKDVRYVRATYDGCSDNVMIPVSLYYLPYNQLVELYNVLNYLNLDELCTYLKDRVDQGLQFAANSSKTEENHTEILMLFTALEKSLQNNSHTPVNIIVDSLFTFKESINWSEDGQALLIRILVNISEGSIDNLQEATSTILQAKEDVELRNPESRIRLTGYTITANGEMNTIRESAERLTIWAAIMVFIILWIFLRGWKQIAASLTIIAIALIWTLALTLIFFEKMNTVTLIMGLILIGLGIDFCIHWLNYNRIKNSDLLNKREHAFRVTKRATIPLLAGAFTTAGAFLCLLILNIQSIREFGWLSAAGITITAMLVLFIMPLLLSQSPLSKTVIHLRHYLQLSGKLFVKDYKTILILFTIIILIGLWAVTKIQYEYNYAKLQVGGLPSYELKQEIIDRFGFASDVLLNKTQGIDQASELKDRLKSNLEIESVLSVSDFVPSTKAKSKKKIIVDAINKKLSEVYIKELDLSHISVMKNSLDQLLLAAEHASDKSSKIISDKTLSVVKRTSESIKKGKLPQLNSFNRNWINSMTEMVKKLSKKTDVSFADLPSHIQEIFKTSNQEEYVQYIYPLRDIWEKEAAEEIEKTLQAEAPSAVGLARLSYHMTKKVMKDSQQMALVAFLVILIIMRLALRLWTHAVLAMAPLIVGGLLTVATLSLLDIKLNLYNLIAVPIILGIGIDDGTHIIHAYRSNKKRSPSLSVIEIGPAVVLTSLTSMIGFGCLAFYSHPGMSSLGVVLFVGVFWCLICSIVLLPALLTWIKVLSKNI
jgi:predicted RND superfamily exporter protein